MTEAVLEKLKRWDTSTTDPFLDGGAIDLVLYLSKRVYCDYEPASMRPFMVGLDKWLSNVSDENDQKVLLSLLSHLFFAGRSEFESLYRSTLTNITRWIVEIDSFDIADIDLPALIDARFQHTWICPITDSLRINSFLKVNGLKGHDHRPHWRSIAKFGDESKVRSYMKDQGINKLVLLEDFVGSGTQVEPTIDFASTEFPDVDILVSPLIVCPKGDDLLKAKAKAKARLSYIPTMVLPDNVLLEQAAKAGEPRAYALARAMFARMASKFQGNPFGFKGTGALVAMFSNCPDNTVAAFREESSLWSPLFPRIWRPE